MVRHRGTRSHLSADELWQAYASTRFRVDGDARARRATFDLRHGQSSPSIDRILSERGVESWAFITAWNPDSRELSEVENARRNADLRSEIERRGFFALPGAGVGEDPAWTPEESLLVLGIRREEALQLGRRFGQKAILVGVRARPAKLVDCATGEDYDGRPGVRG